VFRERPFVGGLTYQGHALACAAGVANVEIYRSDNLVENSRVMGEYMLGKMEEIKARHRSVGDVRCKGLWGCIELTSDKDKRAPLAGYADSRRNVSGELMKRLYASGLYLFAKWDFLFLAPPLIIDKAQIDESMAIIDKALDWTDTLC